jgi:hypothetical protein
LRCFSLAAAFCIPVLVRAILLSDATRQLREVGYRNELRIIRASTFGGSAGRSTDGSTTDEGGFGGSPFSSSMRSTSPWFWILAPP